MRKPFDFVVTVADFRSSPVRSTCTGLCVCGDHQFGGSTLSTRGAPATHATAAATHAANLPTRDGAIGTVIKLSVRDRLRDLRDLFQLLHIQLHAQARTIVGVQLAVLEVEAHWEMRQRLPLEVV